MRKRARNLATEASGRVALVLLLAIFSRAGAAQQAGGNAPPPLVVRTVSLPKAYLRQPYREQLEATGGILPLKWELTEGSLPPGIVLDRDGELAGTPTETGEFRFTVTATDSSSPAAQIRQQLSLSVVAPLWARWDQYPEVSGQRLAGSILVSNQTDQDFDLTAVMLAVNDIGRATAIGYQHFLLKKNSDAIEIPFGDNLPPGSYQLNVDVVAEVAATDSIYRARLVPKERFQIQEGP
jgi:hypothetical protein